MTSEKPNMPSNESVAEMCNAEPTHHHRWLQQMVGTWEYTSTCVMGPDGSTMESKGTEVIRAIGNFWVMSEMTGQMPGTTDHMTGIITLGYDTRTNRYVGTFIGSPMDYMFNYDGTRNEHDTKLELHCQGPSFTDPTTLADYKDTIEFVSKDHRRMTSHCKLPDGTWTEFMRAEYRRVK